MESYKIMGRYQRDEWEELDTSENSQDADYLVQEYRMAFGTEWEIKLVTTR